MPSSVAGGYGNVSHEMDSNLNMSPEMSYCVLSVIVLCYRITYSWFCNKIFGIDSQLMKRGCFLCRTGSIWGQSFISPDLGRLIILICTRSPERTWMYVSSFPAQTPPCIPRPHTCMCRHLSCLVLISYTTSPVQVTSQVYGGTLAAGSAPRKTSPGGKAHTALGMDFGGQEFWGPRYMV